MSIFRNTDFNKKIIFIFDHITIGKYVDLGLKLWYNVYAAVKIK